MSAEGDDEPETVVLGSRAPHDQPLCGEVRTQTKLPGSPRDNHRNAELEPGAYIGPYRICEALGQGGCSTVYVAEHRSRGERVAVKVLSPALALSQRQVRRFVQEAQAVQRIRHSRIVDIYESGYLEDGRPYLAMELIRGRSLAEVMRDKGRFSPRETLELLEPICEALDHAHAAGIVHRDIKASNIMLVDGPPAIKLLDFGIAKLVNDEQGSSLKTTLGHVLGTPYSMAPEQILGHPVDSRTDTYALGALLFRMLTGRHPFPCRDPQMVLHMQLKAPPPKPSAFALIPPAVDEVVQRAMAKDPEHRFATPQAFVSALRQALRPEQPAPDMFVQALAIYVHGCMDEHADIDDMLLADLMNALDLAQSFFRREGFQIGLQTSEAVLGIMVASDDQTYTRALAAARRLHGALAQRVGADVRLHINVCVHGDRARVRPGTQGTRDGRIVGGAITNVGTWAPQVPLDGVHATAEVMGARPASRYIRLDEDTAADSPMEDSPD